MHCARFLHDVSLSRRDRQLAPAMIKNSTPPRTVLIFRSAGLGDFIMSVPAFGALRSRFPDSRLVLLTLQSADLGQAAKVAAYAGGASNAPWVDLITPHLIDEVVALPPLRNASDFWRAARRLDRFDIDLIINMTDVGTPWISRVKKVLFLTALVGSVPQIGWRRQGSIHRSRVPRKNPRLGHHVPGLLQFLDELDGKGSYTNDDITFDLRPGPSVREWALRWRSQYEFQKPIIAVAPGAIHAHKSWPLEKFSALISALLAEYPKALVVIVGSGADAAKAAVLTQKNPARIVSLAGLTSIAESAALFAMCDLVVGNDGGAMHLADAMGAKVVSIVPGLEFPDSVEPWNNRARAIRLPIACAPCYSFTSCPLGHARCMTEIPVSTVLDSCRTSL